MHGLVRAASARALQRKMKVGFPQFADSKRTVGKVPRAAEKPPDGYSSQR